ncbi:hypothetical protein [Acetobacter syzygii]|uniref:Thioredoxin-like fold domain-containing protein n=1 Tax=Acetobacter syzygii TaxID=146476 RepID=A0A270B7D4_9PROT|nr:hypothetical protein [Acetobacter syzygii]NSL92753.1 hypothetical protein [Acetobacter syzygii]PAL20888.1 hypothetical protein B9K05_12405 [Acetobacter syzygii]PAL22968.1 hypothetical protein B9K04_12365 [Acetobacter syzygii]
MNLPFGQKGVLNLCIFVRDEKTFQTFYLTPDQQVIPTIHWKPGTSVKSGQPIGQSAPPPSGEGAVRILTASSFGLYGHADAPRLYMVIDPLCSFSVRALQSLQPYIDKGALELAIVPIAINDHENHNRSTPAAQAMLSVGQRDMVSIWRQIIAQGEAPEDMTPSDTAGAQLQLNRQKAAMINLTGTPTIAWLDKQGRAHQMTGLPDNLDSLITELGQ